jgi:hypothetical protein
LDWLRARLVLLPLRGADLGVLAGVGVFFGWGEADFAGVFAGVLVGDLAGVLVLAGLGEGLAAFWAEHGQEAGAASHSSLAGVLVRPGLLQGVLEPGEAGSDLAGVLVRPRGLDIFYCRLAYELPRH